MEFQTHTLSNGIRIVHQEAYQTAISHCGFIINAGSRDEPQDKQGLAHFIEHSIFKGTKKRKPYHILNRIDSVGGELNAYTAKEETSVYASFLTEYYERSVELLSDIIFNSTFPDKEINKEKDVIIDEINSYNDTPSEQIFDDFEELLFANHPLGRNILGTKETLLNIKRRDVVEFIKKNYTNDKIVFSSVGNISFEKVKAICERYLTSPKTTGNGVDKHPFKKYKPFNKRISRDVYQAHCVIGTIAPGNKKDERIAAVLLNNILGGPAMNTRLNLSIRERYGYTYNLESNYTPYYETGLFTVYLGTDPEYLNRCIDLVYSEFKKLRTQKLGTVQLSNAKKQLIGHIALAQENRLNQMLGAGKSMLVYNKVDPLSKVIKKIEDLKSSEILELSNKLFEPSQLSMLIYSK